MKKTIALLLALVLALGILTACGETKPAETTETTEPTAEGQLREGNAVEVATPEEFAQAYHDLYAEGSTVNAIVLTDDVMINAKDLRIQEGNDPYMTEYPDRIVLRMPEGTQLDLNGCVLHAYALAGADDNTGAKSNNVTLGNVVDSFGGGEIRLYCLNSDSFVGRALKLAREYPGIVSAVTITGEIKNASKDDFVVPENVALKFTGTKSAINAHSITFEPGATIYVGSKAGDAGLVSDCEAIIFQYRDETDKNREGSEFATEFVQVG